jgi:Flp pilus assembly protein TadG
MRRIDPDEDRGVATIFVVLALPVLVLLGALVFDGGRTIVARRQTQNAADSAALAKAQDCALGIASTNFTAYQTNGAVHANSPTCGAGVTTVSMSKTFDFAWRPNPAIVTRTAIARWGTLGGATTLPIVISNCEFQAATLNSVMNITLYLDDPKPQSGCSSLPGGFSQLLTANDCLTQITAGGLAPGSPGADLQKVEKCITPLPKDVLVPLYNAAACQSSGCKGKGPYPILGFAMFHITGYSFNGNNYGGTLGKKCPEEKDRGKYCIQGDFIRFTTTQGTPGPSTDYGVTQVYLSLT